MNPVTLLRLEACQVTRPEPLCRSFFVNPSAPVAKKWAPAGRTFTSLTFPDPKNHRVFLRIGPPTDGLTSTRCLRASGDRREAASWGVKLSDWKLLNDPPA